jgi:hypothetical protein
LAAGDGEDWFQLATPSGCAALAVDVQVTYTIAFEPLAIDLFDGTGTSNVATGGECAHKTTIVGGDDGMCIHAALASGSTYALQIHPAGGGDCQGTCNYNRYTLTLSLGTP